MSCAHCSWLAREEANFPTSEETHSFPGTYDCSPRHSGKIRAFGSGAESGDKRFQPKGKRKRGRERRGFETGGQGKYSKRFQSARGPSTGEVRDEREKYLGIQNP